MFNKNKSSIVSLALIITSGIVSSANVQASGEEIRDLTKEDKKQWDKEKKQMLDEIQELKEMLKESMKNAKEIANKLDNNVNSTNYTIGQYIVLILRISILSILLSALVYVAYLFFSEYQLYKNLSSNLAKDNNKSLSPFTFYLFTKVLGKEYAESLKKEIDSFNELSKAENGGIMNYLYVKVFGKDFAKSLQEEIDNFKKISAENNGLLKYICKQISNEEGFFKNVQNLIEQANDIMNLFNGPSNEKEKLPLVENVSYFMNLADRLKNFSLRCAKYSEKYPATMYNGYNLPYIIPSLMFVFSSETDQHKDPIYNYLVEKDNVNPQELSVKSQVGKDKFDYQVNKYNEEGE